jgi:uncharacterized protein (TIGR02391 family)
VGVDADAIRRIPKFTDQFVRGVCDILAQTEFPGLTGTEIDRLLQSANGAPRDQAFNKRDGLFNSLMKAQDRQKAGNAVSAFIARAMSPERFVANPRRFDDLRDQLNEFLVFHGWHLSVEGKLGVTKGVTTLEAAAELVGRLQTELKRRGIHPALLRYCDEELVSRSLFHATCEAAKSIPSRIREISSLAGDGAVLYDGVFGTGREQPLWSINSLGSESEISEHRGFKNLLVGIHGHFRNPRAHVARVEYSENVTDFYDAFSLFSYIHRRIDAMRRVERDA